MDVAREIRIARRRANLSQAELAARCGTSQATVSAYESGRKTPAIPTLARLLAAADARLTVEPTPPRLPRRAELEAAGRDLAAVLELAQALPWRRPGALAYPRLPT